MMKSLTNTELTTFCSQMGLILRAGLPAAEGLAALMEDTPEGDGRTLLQAMYEGMEAGAPLAEVLTGSGVFPGYMCNMVQLGEQSGQLDDVMEALAQYYQREEAVARSLKNAVAYPLLMLGMMLVVLVVLVVQVLPIFDRVYRQMGAGLTGFAGAVLRFGQMMRQGSVVLLVLAVASVAVCAWFVLSARGRAYLREMSRRFFLTRELVEKIAVARFASGMHLALSSGLDLEESLTAAAGLVEHPGVQAKAEKMRDLMMRGESFAKASTAAGMFSGLNARMLNIGVRVGAVDEVLAQIAARYDAEIERRINDAVAKVQPALVAVLSVVVGVILLSVMLPLMGIMAGIG